MVAVTVLGLIQTLKVQNGQYLTHIRFRLFIKGSNSLSSSRGNH